MKIIHTAASLEDEASGPSYSVPSTLRALHALGHEAQLLSIGPRGTDVSRGFTHHRFKNAAKNLPVLRGLCLSSKMKTHLKFARPDIIHTQGLWLMPNIYAAQIAKQQNIPSVVTVRGMLAPAALEYSKLKKAAFGLAFQRQALKQASLFHATSQQEYEDIRSYGLSQPVLIAPNGINLPDLVSRPQSDRKKLLFFGRLHPIKGLDNLIDAWAKIEPLFPDWDLEIRGTGHDTYIKSLKQRIADHALSRATIGTGVFGNDKTELYQSADLYILPSESENFAITVAESLAAETPVICTRGAPWSGLETHNAGWWVQQDSLSLEHCLKFALNVPPLELIRMGKNGRKWMAKDFSWESVAKQLESAYAFLLKSGDAPTSLHIT